MIVNAIEEARALIEAAREDPQGEDFLMEGPPDEVAEAFHVHPYLVFRARGITRKLLDFSRKLEPRLAPCNVNRLLDDVVRGARLLRRPHARR